MRQLMGQLSPMAAPQGHDMGGMLMQGMNAWQGMKRADAEKIRQDAMINALKNVSPNQFGMRAGGAGGMFSMPVDQALPMSATPQGY